MIYLRIRGVIMEEDTQARTLTPTDIPGTQGSLSLLHPTARHAADTLHGTLPFYQLQLVVSKRKKLMG